MPKEYGDNIKLFLIYADQFNILLTFSKVEVSINNCQNAYVYKFHSLVICHEKYQTICPWYLWIYVTDMKNEAFGLQPFHIANTELYSSDVCWMYINKVFMKKSYTSEELLQAARAKLLAWHYNNEFTPKKLENNWFLNGLRDDNLLLFIKGTMNSQQQLLS